MGEKAELYRFPLHEDLSLLFSQKSNNGGSAASGGSDASITDMPYFNYTDYLQGSVDYGFGFQNSDVKSELAVDVTGVRSNNLSSAGTGPVTPNSSISSSSSEANGDDQEPGRYKKEKMKLEEEREEEKEDKGDDEDCDKSKKV